MGEKGKILFWSIGAVLIILGFGMLIPIPGTTLALLFQFSGFIILIVLSLYPGKKKRRKTSLNNITIEPGKQYDKR